MTAEILLVDDNAIQAWARKSILLRTHRAVVIAEGAAQALAMLEDPALASSLGLVVTDHIMPGMDGPEFVAHLRVRMPDIPVIVLSGLPGAEDEYDGKSVVFRLKPIAPDHLIALAESLLEAVAMPKTA